MQYAGDPQWAYRLPPEELTTVIAYHRAIEADAAEARAEAIAQAKIRAALGR